MTKTEGIVLENLVSELKKEGLSLDSVLNAISKPCFEESGRVHDWRNYVPRSFIKYWDSLDDVTKIGLYILAEQSASEEKLE